MNESNKFKNTIVVEVQDGVVWNVHNLPDGWSFIIADGDLVKVGEASREEHENILAQVAHNDKSKAVNDKKIAQKLKLEIMALNAIIYVERHNDFDALVGNDWLDYPLATGEVRNPSLDKRTAHNGTLAEILEKALEIVRSQM